MQYWREIVMRDSLERICEQFLQARDIIKKSLPMESGYMYPLCALAFVGAETVPSEDVIKKNNELIKHNTGAFSGFRACARPVIISLLSVGEQDRDAEGTFKNILGAYFALKECFWDQGHLPFAAAIMAQIALPSDFESACTRVSQLYELMKKDHAVITSRDDIPFCVLLAEAELSCERIEAHAEECYRLLKPEFTSHNSVQALSHVLTLFEGEASEKCRRTLELFNTLKSRGLKYGKVIELSTLGALATLPDQHKMVDDIAEVDAYLADQDGYGGIFGFGKQQRLMHAGMIVISERARTAIGSERSLYIRARDIALCAGINAAIWLTTNSN